MKRRSAVFLKESVILVGFLNGVWVAVGVNPAREIVDVLAGAVLRMDPARPVVAVVALLPFLFLALTLYFVHKAWRKGRWMGMGALALGFVAGLYVLADPVACATILAAALLLGYAATR